MDVLTPEQRRKNMQQIKNKDTSIEIKLRRALWQAGYRCRKNYAKLQGKPDIVITKYKVAIFCDSEFFHGKDWPELKVTLSKGNNQEFWIRKIEKNMERDKRNDELLRKQGWRVLHFWGGEINTDNIQRKF